MSQGIRSNKGTLVFCPLEKDIIMLTSYSRLVAAKENGLITIGETRHEEEVDDMVARVYNELTTKKLIKTINGNDIYPILVEAMERYYGEHLI